MSPESQSSLPDPFGRLLGRLLAIFGVCLLLSTGADVAYTTYAVHSAVSTQQQLRAREEQSAVRTAVPECRALVALDHARIGAIFPHYPGPEQSEGYGMRLSVQIHNVVVASKCEMLLTDLANHVPISQIAKELGAH